MSENSNQLRKYGKHVNLVVVQISRKGKHVSETKARAIVAAIAILTKHILQLPVPTR